MQSAHICSKCGWGFPNPHPSAKQRRAHKKVCGKVEGFKIHESQDDIDQEHSNKGEVVVNEEMGSGLMDRQISNKSEEEEFSDAVNEFAEPDLKGSTIASIMNATTLPMDGVAISKKMETVTLEQKMSLTELHSGIRSRSTDCGASEKAYSSVASFKDEDYHACFSDIENHNGSYENKGSNNLLNFSNEELPEATVKDQNKNVPVKLEVYPTPDFSEATTEIEFQNPSSMDVHPGLSGKSVEGTNVSPLATLDLEGISQQKEMCSESNMDEGSTTHGADISEAKDVYQGLDISTLPDLKFCDVGCSNTETNQMVCFEEQEPHYSQQDKPSKSLPPSLTESGDVIISPEPAIVHQANNAGSGKADSLHEDAKKDSPDISVEGVAEDHSMQMKTGFGAPSSIVELEENLLKSEADSLHEDAKKDSPDLSGKHIEGVAEDHSMQMKTGFGAPSSIVELEENLLKSEADSLHEDAKKDSPDLSGKHIEGVAEDHSMQMKIGVGAPSSFVELEENLQKSGADSLHEDAKKDIPDISGKHIGGVAEDHSMQMKIGVGVPSSFVELEENLQKSGADSLHEDAKKDIPDISGKHIGGVAEDHSMQMKIGFGAPSSFVELEENLQKSEADSLHEDAKKDNPDISGKHIGGVAEDHSMQIGFGAPSSFVELEENLQKSEPSPLNCVVQPSAVVINTTKLENMPEYLSESQNGHGKNLLEISKEFEAERAETSCKEINEIEFVGADGSYDTIKELAPSAVMSVPSALNSSSLEDSTEVLGLEDASDVSFSSLKEDDFLLDKQLEALATVPREGSVDSISQTDSVEGCWGSVSDGKIPSSRDAMHPSSIPAAEVLPGSDSQVPNEEDQVPESKKTRSYEDQYSSHSDVCEAPSILTLAEFTGENAQNLQKSHASSLQAAVNELQGRKTNEEMIEKLAKVRAPLKSFLVEPNFESSQDATARGNPKSPASEDGASSKIAPPTANLEASTNNGLTKNIDKEWSSPARLPDSRQKRKTKWVPFLCCLSVN